MGRLRSSTKDDSASEEQPTTKEVCNPTMITFFEKSFLYGTFFSMCCRMFTVGNAGRAAASLQ